MAEEFTKYSVDESGQFKAAIDKAAQAVDDLKIPFSLIANDFYRGQKAIFQLSNAGPYPDLSAAYKKRKQAQHGKIYPILKANGFLEVAATVQGGSGNITEIGEKTLTFGVDDRSIPYAAYHQSDKPRQKIPLRKYLFIGPEEPKFALPDHLGRPERWIGILNEFVLQKLKDSGAGKVRG